ncbi:MAG: hypothetical protein FOGNACKC_01411 [Anaerolineae bacterium]|nr:hypothetical protein [Anaerolineae bacterium]
MSVGRKTAKPQQDWYLQLIDRILVVYAKKVNLDYFKRKYAGLPAEAIAARRIKSAARIAGLAGFSSGVIISLSTIGAVASAASAVASSFTTLPVTLPVVAISVPIAALSFGVEVAIIVRIQLHLAYDLFVLYRLPVDVEDPEEMYQVATVAFGIKGAELGGQGLQKLVPQLAPQLLRKAMRTGLVRRKIQGWFARRLGWQFARRYLGEGILIRWLVPGLAVITATGWDYFSTQAIGSTLHNKIRRRGLAAKEVDKLDLKRVTNVLLFVKSILALALTDYDLSETEFTFYSTLIEELRKTHGDEAVDSVKDTTFFEWQDILTELTEINGQEERVVFYEALISAAVVEGQFKRAKRKRLESVAKMYDLPFNVDSIKSRTEIYKEPNPTRTCLVTVLFIFGFMMLSCGLCSYGIYLSVQ